MQSISAEKLSPNPREKANPLSILTFFYALPILFKGHGKTLSINDLPKPLSSHKADNLGEKLSSIWFKEVEICRRKKKEPSLLKVIASVFGFEFAIFGLLLLFLEIGTRATQPLLLAGLISEFTNGRGSDITARWYAVGLIFCTIANVLVTHPVMMGIMHLAMKMRIAISSTIFRKALRLSKTALVDTTSGQIVNLLSNDLGRLDRALIHVHFLWLAPLELFFALYFMYNWIGIASFFGMAIMLLFLPLQTYFGKLVSSLRLRTALRTDKRVRMMNEIIMGIQVIKMYAWERPFGVLIDKVRRREMSVIRKVNYLRGILNSFEITLSRFSIFVSLVAYVLLGNQLNAETAFFITAFYNILRRTVTKFFPQGMSQIAELFVSLDRVKKFLLRDEIKIYDNTLVDDVEKENVLYGKQKDIGALMPINGRKNSQVTMPVEANNSLIWVKNLKAKWDVTAAEYVLDDINLKLKSHQLVAIIGPVGSGKSSLIQAMMGELVPESGTIQMDCSFSYAAQEPWLFTGTVRDNILFGTQMDKRRYNAIVRHCALTRDFELLPFKDKTIVGERGAALSGGQRARIALARALYRKTDAYLLDDPLSAVDTHVGRHLFDNCLRDFLQQKLVVLVTHQLQFLEQADLIIIMDKGKISAMGTYKSMLKSGLDFAQLLTQTNQMDEHVKVEKQDDLSSLSRRSSRMSVSSDTSDDLPIDEIPDDRQKEESRSTGKIGLKMYWKYFSSGAGFCMFFLLIFLCLGTQLTASGADYFLSYWVKSNEESTNVDDIYYFTIFNVGLVLFALLRTYLFFNLASRCSRNLHNCMFKGLSSAAMHFFNVNPSGRILNRFAMDLGQVDEVLPPVMIDVIQIFLTLAGVIAVLCIANPWNLILTGVLLLSFYFVREFYLNTSRDVKRLEAVARSPLYSHLGTSMNGLSTIRAMGAQKMLIAEYDNYQDIHSCGYFTFLSTSRAFGYYLDCFCVIYIIIIILNYFVNPPENAGQIGLVITQAMSMAGMVQWGMRQSAELENAMTSVERLVEYKEMEPEGKFETPPDKKPTKCWPDQGEIVAIKLSMRYVPDLKSERVLKSVNFHINPCEKVGIVGRTGAGKSSLINALFRLSYNDGTILIDKHNINDLGLYDLRSKISIIPQEPVLFSGTMRYNLDPFEQYSDKKLWSALEEVKLKDAIIDLPSGLHSAISEGGSNFSVGQRQLVCLARAILRENKILIMDEATANVDLQTDALIQATIRNKFKNCTVLTIAHRLHTIMDSDKVLVMDAGQVVEFASPYELLTATKTKVFHDMVKQTGNATFENLMQVAKKSHEESLQRTL